MFRYAITLLFATAVLAGCAMEVGAPEGEGLGEAEEAVTGLNGIDPNGIDPNGIDPNGIDPNGLAPTALTPTTIASTAMTALQNPGSAGSLSRSFLQYAVSCAFTPSQSFSVTWTDGQAQEHTETYWGSLGLASDWQSRALSPEEQEWVSACIAAKANQYHVSMLISLRNTASSPALTANDTERTRYPYREGAFWGNLFAAQPALYSCYDADNIDHSRDSQRVCATGFIDGGLQFCANIATAGSCADVCTIGEDAQSGFTSCGSSSQVITTFLE